MCLLQSVFFSPLLLILSISVNHTIINGISLLDLCSFVAFWVHGGDLIVTLSSVRCLKAIEYAMPLSMWKANPPMQTPLMGGYMLPYFQAQQWHVPCTRWLFEL